MSVPSLAPLVTGPATPSATILNYSIVQMTNVGVTVLFRVQLAGGQQPYTLSWSYGDGKSDSVTLSGPPLAPGSTVGQTHVYPPSPMGASFQASVVLTDLSGQKVMSSIMVIIPPVGTPVTSTPVPPGGAPVAAAPVAPTPFLAPGPMPLTVSNLAFKIVQVSQQGTTVGFTVSVSGGAMPFTNLLWNFGDGTAAVQAPSGVTHLFPPAGGTFVVNATASDFTLAQATASGSVTIPPVPPPPAVAAPFPTAGAAPAPPPTQPQVIAPPVSATVAFGILGVFAVAVAAFFLLSRGPRD